MAFSRRARNGREPIWLTGSCNSILSGDFAILGTMRSFGGMVATRVGWVAYASLLDRMCFSSSISSAQRQSLVGKGVDRSSTPPFPERMLLPPRSCAARLFVPERSEAVAQ